MSSTHRSHYFHLIWSTKLRKNLLPVKIQDGVYPYLKGIANGLKTTIVEIGGTSDHIHILLRVGNLDNFSTIIRNLKTSSTTWLKGNFPECKEFGWQDGYGSFSVSLSQVDVVRKYIQNQEAHHSRVSFEDEYIQFLKINGIDFDPKYVFD